MQRRTIIMNLRNYGKLKGVKPCFISMKNNLGKIYTEGQADFVMSIKNDKLYFQKLTFFLRRLKPADDFSLDIRTLRSYALFEKPYHNILYLYDVNKRFLEIHYFKGTPDMYPTEDNILRIIKVLEERGIKKWNPEEEIDEEDDTKRSGTD